MMDKTIESKRTLINFDLIRLSKKMNILRDDNLDLIRFPRKPNRLTRAKTMEMGSPTQTKILKLKQFGLTCEQQKIMEITQKTATSAKGKAKKSFVRMLFVE